MPLSRNITTPLPLPHHNPAMQNPTKRRLIALACILPSALLAFSWLYSYLPQDFLIRSDDGRLYWYSIIVNGGELNSWYAQLKRENATRAWHALQIAPRQAELKRVSFLGVHYMSHPGPGEPIFHAVSIPYPYLFFPALLPVWVYYRNRIRRHAPGSVPCPICHYDMRTTPDRCPECGMGAGKI
jgi:hypothetical protein